MIAWIGMVIYIQFFDPKLGSNVLYVTQISHWALVLACGTAATATWGVITTRTHAKQLEQEERHRDGQGVSK